MTILFILLILLVFIGGICLSLARDRKVQSAESPKETLPFNTTDNADPMKQITASDINDTEHRTCTLATTLRAVGVVDVFAALIIGLVLADDFSWVISMAAILSGCLGCLFCYALAKCVDAADKYLNSH